MSFILMKEQDVPKSNGTYSVKLYLDEDTNTLRNEYCLNNEVLYFTEYEVAPFVIPDQDIPFNSIIEAFHSWYDYVGPDWRPVSFYLDYLDEK